MGKGRPRKPPGDRFWKLVARSEQPDGCWFWLGATAAETGYGVFNDGEKARLAHVFAFELTRPGLDRTGLVVRHTCDTPVCVNPRHLRLGSHKDNSRDMDDRGRRVNNPVKGEAHYAAKLDADKVAEIRRLASYDDASLVKYSAKELAKRYGVSVTTITAIIQGRTWKHVK